MATLFLHIPCSCLFVGRVDERMKGAVCTSSLESLEPACPWQAELHDKVSPMRGAKKGLLWKASLEGFFGRLAYALVARRPSNTPAHKYQRVCHAFAMFW